MIIIDAGHGGSDPGASSRDIVEKDYTLKISNYMYDRFNQLGIPVYITRTTDQTLSPPDRINKIKQNIKSSDDIVISNHLNAGGGDGAEVIYSIRNNDLLSKNILNNIEKTGQNIRKWYQRKLPNDNSKDYYYIIRETEPAESILIEYGFLDSNKDDRQQIKNDWQKWAESVVETVAKYKGYNYAAPNINTVNNEYTVQKGDSLWSIAKKFNVGLNELKNINGLNSNLISIGQNLVIPGYAPSTQTNVTYVVQKGDTLWGIATANNTTVDEIINLNNLGMNSIYEGQVLSIPNSDSQENVDLQTYVVQKGDTIYGISQKYNVNPEKLADENNITNGIIYVGQILQIPSDIESTGNDYNELNNNNLYIVQKGDTLWSISRKYNVSINDIRKINNLNSDILNIGQTLLIP